MDAVRVGLLSAILVPALVSPAVAQSYNPVGPQTGVAITTVTDGGWVECYSAAYNTATGDDLAQIQAACTGARIMLACGPAGGDTLSLLSQATAAEVFTDPGTQFNDSHLANGAQWYFSLAGSDTGAFSWGFADEGADVDRDNCDTETDDAELRLCWHLDPGIAGFRCGDDVGLEDSDQWTKYVYTSADVVPTANPWQLVLLLVLLSAGGAVVLRRRMSARPAV